jgi:hypothetical protein
MTFIIFSRIVIPAKASARVQPEGGNPEVGKRVWILRSSLQAEAFRLKPENDITI